MYVMDTIPKSPNADPRGKHLANWNALDRTTHGEAAIPGIATDNRVV